MSVLKLSLPDVTYLVLWVVCASHAATYVVHALESLYDQAFLGFQTDVGYYLHNEGALLTLLLAAVLFCVMGVAMTALRR